MITKHYILRYEYKNDKLIFIDIVANEENLKMDVIPPASQDNTRSQDIRPAEYISKRLTSIIGTNKNSSGSNPMYNQSI